MKRIKFEVLVNGSYLSTVEARTRSLALGIAEQHYGYLLRPTDTLTLKKVTG